MFSQLHMLLPVTQEVSDPPAGGVRHTQLGELLLKQSRDDGVKGRAEIHTQDPGVGSCGVQVLADVMEGQVDCIVYRPVDDAQRSPHRGQGDRSEVVPVVLGFLGTGMIVDVLKQAVM